MSVRKVGFFSLLLIGCFWSVPSLGQVRGKIIRPASTSVMDPNGDGYVSKTNAGFSGDGTGYYVNEFELTMFGIPILGSGDVTGDNIGNACGITDLIPDIKGYSVYAVHDSNDNLIFRFRVGDDNPSVEAWTILLDTDGLFGANDPNSTADNPGFELDITLIKRNNAGVYVYKIDGIDNCPGEDLFYSIDSHFQISQADESSCGDPDYFYDFYVPFSALASKYGISSATGMRFAATTNTSATCAMSGNIADVGGVDNNLPAYSNCVSCAFVDLVNNQCPTALTDLCQTCAGFEKNKVSAPRIDLPLRAGQQTITGTTVESNIYIRVQAFTNTAASGNPPTWGTTPREEKAGYAVGNIWSMTLTNPLLANDKIVAIAQKDEFSVPCGANGNNTSSTSVTVVQPNTPPVATNQTVTLPEDTQVSITLTGTDPENDPLFYSIVSTPGHGTLTGAGTNYSYTPDLNYNGSDVFTFQVGDGIFSSVITGTVSINVTPVNDAPVANSQSVITAEDVAKAIVLTAVDIDGNTLTYSIVAGPAHGTLTGTLPNLTYTPSGNYNGPDNFTFKTHDGTVDSNSGTVSITVTAVNDAPLASAQSITTAEDIAKAITLVGTDADGNALTYSIVGSPTHGTLSGSGANRNYTPASNYNGTDNFTFRVNDGTLNSNTATVSITITAVNDAPVANSQSVNYVLNTPKAIVLTGSDPESDPLTYTIIGLPANGVLTGSAPNVTYTPNASFNGADNFTFRVNDGSLNSAIANVFLSVDPGSNVAPVAFNQSVVIVEDAATAIHLVASDANSADVLTFSVVSAPLHGTLAGSGPDVTYTPFPNNTQADVFTFRVFDGTTFSNTATVGITFTPVLDAPAANDQSISTPEDTAAPIILTGSSPDGNSIASYTVVSGPSQGTLTGSGANRTYTPSADYNGPDVFTFKVNDGTDSNIATISITVTPVNDAPVSVSTGSTVTTNEDTPTLIILVSSDVDGDPLTYTIVTPPAHGTLTGTGPDVFYTPDANYDGPDGFTFFTNDGTTNSNTGTVPITVLPVNDAPVATDDSGITHENRTLILTGITTNDTDIDGTVSPSTVDLNLATGGVQGSLTNVYGAWTVNASGDVTFIPALDYSGNASIGYTVNDDLGATSNAATLTITVIGVVGPPQANSDVGMTDEDISVVVPTITSNDISNGGIIDPTTIDLNPSAAGIETTFTNATGTWSVDGSGNLTYAPAINYNGVATIYYTVTDNSGATSNSASVNITVNPVNDVPVLGDLMITTDRNLAVIGNVIDPLDADPDGTVLVGTITPITPPQHGVLVINTDGSFTYTPVEEYVGSDQARVEVCDSGIPLPAACATKLINFEIKAVNRPPVVIINSEPGESLDITTPEDTPVLFCFQTTDPDGDVVEVKSFTNLKGGGKLAPDGSAPFCYQFIPAKDYNGIAIWEAQVCDNGSPSLCGKLIVTIAITPVNDAPVAVRDSVGVLRKTPFEGNVLLNDFDIEGDRITLSIVSVKNVMHGQVTLEADGRFRYSSDLTYRGIDSLVYKICDSGTPKGCSEATLVINVGDLPLRVYEGVSPNGDGNNDYMRIEGIDYYTENQVRIFDRYNNEVFQLSGYNNEDRVWNGQANKGLGTSVLPEGPYYYVIHLGDGSAPINGFVVLKRN